MGFNSAFKGLMCHPPSFPVFQADILKKVSPPGLHIYSFSSQSTFCAHPKGASSGYRLT